MSPEEFRSQWGTDVFVEFPEAILSDLNISADSKGFFAQAGLPQSAASFFDFKVPQQNSLPRASDEWQLSEDFAEFRIVGSDGSGNPICIDESAEGTIVVLDHERGFQRKLVNSSVRQLALSLLAYRRFVNDVQGRNGESAFLDGNIPPALLLALRNELAILDSVALDESGFWSQELANLETEIL